MRKDHIILIILFSATLLWYAPPAFSAEQGLSAGFGFGLFNHSYVLGKIEGDKVYDFVQLAYVWERRSHVKSLAVLFEPFAAYTIAPREGADGGFNLCLKYYFLEKGKRSYFLTAGSGMAYTSQAFEGQGTHLLFILQGGAGIRWDKFFIETRFRHYSNGTTAWPNRSINANIISIGHYF